MAGGAALIGGSVNPFETKKPPPILPTSSFGNPSTFTAAANTQASDYDRIMAQYADLAKSYAANPMGISPGSTSQVAAPTQVNYNSVTPQTATYSQSPDVTNSLATLSELSSTGGYSDADKQDIRARDISPIRSIYANAQENVERQKSLAGGYSPNFNAVTARMSRDEANKISDVTTAANAGIAQNVASNRIAAASPYASASAGANAARTAADARNADIVNQVNQANSEGNLRAGTFNSAAKTGVDENNANRSTQIGQFNRGGQLDAIRGQASLYGTTPALTSLFGNQVIQAGQLGQGQQEINQQKRRDTYNFARPGAS